MKKIKVELTETEIGVLISLLGQKSIELEKEGAEASKRLDTINNLAVYLISEDMKARK